MLVFFRSSLGKSLLWEKSSTTRESDIKVVTERIQLLIGANRISKFERKLVARKSSEGKQESTL